MIHVPQNYPKREYELSEHLLVQDILDILQLPLLIHAANQANTLFKNTNMLRTVIIDIIVIPSTANITTDSTSALITPAQQQYLYLLYNHAVYYTAALIVD
jgi:hypothetical protein